MTEFTAKHFYFTDHYRKCAACRQSNFMFAECRYEF